MRLPDMLTPAQFLSLASLSIQPMHAYAIRQEILEFCGHMNWPAPKTNVRRALQALLEHGLIEDCADPHYWVTKRRDPGSIYELTAEGRRRLDREIKMHLRVIDRLWVETHRQEIAERTLTKISLRDYLAPW